MSTNVSVRYRCFVESRMQVLKAITDYRFDALSPEDKYLAISDFVKDLVISEVINSMNSMKSLDDTQTLSFHVNSILHDLHVHGLIQNPKRENINTKQLFDDVVLEVKALFYKIAAVEVLLNVGKAESANELHVRFFEKDSNGVNCVRLVYDRGLSPYDYD